MSYTIKHRQDPGHYRLTISGEAKTPEVLTQVARDLEDIVLKAGAEKVLLDITRLKGRFGLFEGMKHTRTIPESMKGVRMAVLDLPENKSVDMDFETFTVSHGFQFRFFTVKESALSWLLRD